MILCALYLLLTAAMLIKHKVKIRFRLSAVPHLIRLTILPNILYLVLSRYGMKEAAAAVMIIFLLVLVRYLVMPYFHLYYLTAAGVYALLAHFGLCGIGPEDVLFLIRLLPAAVIPALMTPDIRKINKAYAYYVFFSAAAVLLSILEGIWWPQTAPVNNHILLGMALASPLYINSFVFRGMFAAMNKIE